MPPTSDALGGEDREERAPHAVSKAWGTEGTYTHLVHATLTFSSCLRTIALRSCQSWRSRSACSLRICITWGRAGRAAQRGGAQHAR